MPAEDFTDDAVLGGRLVLRPPRTGHRVGHDAILLAAATDVDDADYAVELGAGVGAAGLALAQRVTGLTATLVEIDPSLATLAEHNAARNGLAGRVQVAVLDVAGPVSAFANQGIQTGSAGCVLMNPPFNDPARQNVSPDPQRRLAHAPPQLRIFPHQWRRALFNHLLMPPLNRTLAFAQMNHVPVPVPQHLNFDVPRL